MGTLSKALDKLRDTVDELEVRAWDHVPGDDGGFHKAVEDALFSINDAIIDIENELGL